MKSSSIQWQIIGAGSIVMVIGLLGFLIFLPGIPRPQDLPQPQTAVEVDDNFEIASVAEHRVGVELKEVRVTLKSGEILTFLRSVDNFNPLFIQIIKTQK